MVDSDQNLLLQMTVARRHITNVTKKLASASGLPMINNKYKKRKNSRFIFRLFALCLIYSFFIYILPSWISADYTGAFDAFGYASALVEGGGTSAFESQRFLNFFPPLPYGLISPHIVALVFNFALLIPALLIASRYSGGMIFRALCITLLLPESLLFLSCVSKEGLAIVGLSWIVAGVGAFHNATRKIGMVLFFVGAAICEISRPAFGFVVAIAFFLSIYVNLPRLYKLFYLVLISVLAPFLVWFLFLQYGDNISKLYSRNLQFAIFVEEKMGSESGIKRLIRGYFVDYVNTLDLSLFGVLLSFPIIIIKPVIYAFAIPLISLPNYPVPTAQTWAMNWQLGVTISSICLIYLLSRVVRHKVLLDHASRQLIVFSLGMAIVVAWATIFVHVRYRIPSQFLLLVTLFTFIPLPKRILSRIFCLSVASLMLGTGLGLLPFLWVG